MQTRGNGKAFTGLLRGLPYSGPYQSDREDMRQKLEQEADSTEAHCFDNAKRQQIMEGARRIFLRDGFDGASIGDIVRAAGVSKGTLYAYFPGKEMLFEA